jgi:N-formylglutamate amidohydrolase
MPGSIPGDLVLGTFEGGACSPELEARALAALSRPRPAGTACVRLNDPYRGGELVRKFGRPEHGVHALQLEVNRALYMDEANLVLRPEVRALAVSHPPSEIPDTATAASDPPSRSATRPRSRPASSCSTV